MSDRINVWVQRFKDRPTLMLQWIDPATGKRKSCSAKTDNLKKAEKKRGDKEYELNNGLHTTPSKVTWKKFRQLFEEEYLPGVRERTREKYATVLDVIEDEMKPERLAQVDERFLSKLVSALRSRKIFRGKFTDPEKEKKREPSKVGLEPVSIRNYLVAFHKAVAWAHEQKLLVSMPRFPKVKVPKKKPQAVPAEAFERLIEAEKDPLWKAYLQTSWWSGLRLSEAWMLRWNASNKFPHVDMEENRIVLPAEFAKTNEDQWVPLHPELRAIFETLSEDTDRLFPFRSKRTGKLMSRGGISSHVSMIAKRAGVRLSMHRLRKGFGCRVAQTLGKQNAPVLHRLMRHSSMQMTMDFYANVDDVLTEAIEQVR